MAVTPLILSISPWEKERLNDALSVQQRPLSSCICLQMPTLRSKLAKASLQGEGQGEGRFPHYWRRYESP